MTFTDTHTGVNLEGPSSQGQPLPIKPSDGLVIHMQATSGHGRKLGSLPTGEPSHSDVNKPAGAASDKSPLYGGGKLDK